MRERAEAGKFVQRDRGRQFARAVGAEVEADDLVAVCHRRSLADHVRLDEFVALVGGVGILDRRARARRGRSLAFNDRAPRSLDALPSLVAIHRVVASGDRRDSPAPKLLQLRFELVDERKRRARRFVAPVEHGVNRNPARAIRRSDVEQRDQMIDMAVHAAVGKQSPDVQRGPFATACLIASSQRRIARESSRSRSLS